jgi:membrane associated rhomboid family serine protease
MIPIRDALPRRRAPLVNYLLILLNVLAFVWERWTIGVEGLAPRALLHEYGLTPRLLLQHPVDYAPTVLTSMFLHDPGGWAHIGGNMLFLWIFGDNVEDALGRARYLLFYLLSGFAAAAAQIMIDPYSPVAMVGASGAIAGVLAAYVTLYPWSRITVLNPIPLLWLFFGLFLELPAWFVIGEFFVMNVLYGLGMLGGHALGGVAFFAHIGGFVAGLLLVRLFLDDPRGRHHDRWSGFRMQGGRPPRRTSYAFHPPPHDPWDG